jgi:hypothetical protein
MNRARGDRKPINVAIGAELNLHGRPELTAAEAARAAGNAPNSVLAAAASIVGPRRAQRAREAAAVMIDLFARAGVNSALDEAFDLGSIATDAATRESFVSGARDATAEAMLAGPKARGQSVFVRYLESLPTPSADAVLAAITCTLAWGRHAQARVPLTAESLPWWMRLFGALIGASVNADRHETDRLQHCNRGDPWAALADGSGLCCLAQLTPAGQPVRLPDAGGLPLTTARASDFGAGREGCGVRRRTESP